MWRQLWDEEAADSMNELLQWRWEKQGESQLGWVKASIVELMKTATVLVGNTAIDGEVATYLVECGGAPANLPHVALLAPPSSVIQEGHSILLTIL
jgi:hypothetical protein